MNYLIISNNQNVGISIKRFLKYNNHNAEIVLISELHRSLKEINTYDIIITDIYENCNGFNITYGLQYAELYIKRAKYHDKLVPLIGFYNSDKIENHDLFKGSIFYLPDNLQNLMKHLLDKLEYIENFIEDLIQIFPSSTLTSTNHH